MLVELLAYFFLVQYRRTLDEVRYYHNELTTIEMRLMAMDLAKSDPEAQRMVIGEAMRTDRNAKLATGESTVEIEKERLHGSLLSSVERLSLSVGDLAKKVKTGGE